MLSKADILPYTGAIIVGLVDTYEIGHKHGLGFLQLWRKGGEGLANLKIRA